MKKALLLLLLCPALLAAADVERKIGHLNITNAPTLDGYTFDINGDTRTFTNDVSVDPTSLILTNDTIDGIQTNLYNHIADTPFGGTLYMYKVSTNSITFEAQEGDPLVITLGGPWGYVQYSTNLTYSTNAYSVTVPADQEDISTRTNIWSEVVYGINNYSSNAFLVSSPAVSNLVNLTAAQTITGNKVFNGSNYWVGGTIIAGAISGNAAWFTNGYWTNSILDRPITTNLVNYGSAISSPGSGLNSEEFGTGSVASGEGAFAAGDSALASGDFSTAVGSLANAIAYQATAWGYSSSADGTNALAGGYLAIASGMNSLALGPSTSATASNSAAVGPGASSGTADLFVLGTSSHHISIPGRLSVSGQGVTNLTEVGRTTNSGSYATPFTTLSTLANGANSLSIGDTTLTIRLTGSISADSTIDGITNHWDGRWLALENQEGYTVTINNESGLESTAANRIVTPSGNNIPIVAKGWATLVYDGTAARWKLKDVYPVQPSQTYTLTTVYDSSTNIVIDFGVPENIINLTNVGLNFVHVTNCAPVGSSRYATVALWHQGSDKTIAFNSGFKFQTSKPSNLNSNKTSTLLFKSIGVVDPLSTAAQTNVVVWFTEEP